MRPLISTRKPELRSNTVWGSPEPYLFWFRAPDRITNSITYTALRISRKRHKPTSDKKEYRVNNRIKARVVQVIDEIGARVGEMDIDKALALAAERGFDLVEVSPKAEPPVAKLIDYNKFKYEEQKEARKAQSKQKKVDIKGIRLTFRMGKHDVDLRLNQAKKFLAEGQKVRIEMMLKGRERRHTDLAKENIQEFINNIKATEDIKVEQNLDQQGNKLNITIAKQ